MRIKSILAFILYPPLLFLIANGCGYRFIGTGGELPGGLRTIAISSLENRTPEPNLNTTFVAALRKELIFRGEPKLTSLKEAESILQGTFRSFTIHSLSYDEEGRVSEHRVTITVDLLLVHQKSGEILWQGNSITGFADYIASSDVMVNEARKNSAIRKIAADLAEEISIRIQERF